MFCVVKVRQSDAIRHVGKLRQIFYWFKSVKVFDEPGVFARTKGVIVDHENNSERISVNVQRVKEFAKFQCCTVTAALANVDQVFKDGKEESSVEMKMAQ